MTEWRHSLDYWAGLFDGEGSIFFSVDTRAGVHRSRITLKISVSNTHLGVIEELAHDFPPPYGGAYTHYLGGPKDQVRRKQQYKWSLTGFQAYSFLSLVANMLIIKREEALLAIEFYEKPWRSQREGRGGGWKIRSDQEVAIDLGYVRRLKEIRNASGF